MKHWRCLGKLYSENNDARQSIQCNPLKPVLGKYLCKPHQYQLVDHNPLMRVFYSASFKDMIDAQQHMDKTTSQVLLHKSQVTPLTVNKPVLHLLRSTDERFALLLGLSTWGLFHNDDTKGPKHKHLK